MEDRSVWGTIVPGGVELLLEAWDEVGLFHESVTRVFSALGIDELIFHIQEADYRQQ